MTFVISNVKPQLSGANRPLALSQGDPAGVGPAASLLAWKALKQDASTAFYVRGRPEFLEREAERLRLDCPVVRISSPRDALSAFADGLPVLATGDNVAVTAGVPQPDTASGIINAISECVRDIYDGEADGIVTNPISKSLLYSAGFAHPGHTEFLAHLAGEHENLETPPLPIMMLVGGGLRVALATIHIPLMQVASQLSADHIARVGGIVSTALKKDFGIAAPRLGVCGLNPHAGESGTIGSEDKDLIEPAIIALRKDGHDVIGPRPGDTIFHEALTGAYDGVLAMYHDQGLIPVKTLDIWGGVNVTLGLPFVRTSPDHGTGYDAAASGQIRAESLIAAIRLARQMADHRKQKAVSHD